MKFRQLLTIVENEPLFETGLLLAGDVDPADLRKQLSRWVRAGKILQLRRGLYALAPPYRKVVPHPFRVANLLQPGSYVSLQSALAHYGMIPEGVPATTSVTTGRPADLGTPLGQFEFHHVRVSWLHGYVRVDLGDGQEAFVASPEKALLDLAYLRPGGDSPAYLRSLRLQSLERVDRDRLLRLAEQASRPKLRRAAEVIHRLAEKEKEEYQDL